MMTSQQNAGSQVDGLSSPYSRALGWIEQAARQRDKLTDEQITMGWTTGVMLIDIAQQTGLHYVQVLDRVRALGLADRCPATRALLPALPAHLTGI